MTDGNCFRRITDRFICLLAPDLDPITDFRDYLASVSSTFFQLLRMLMSCRLWLLKEDLGEPKKRLSSGSCRWIQWFMEASWLSRWESFESNAFLVSVGLKVWMRMPSFRRTTACCIC